VKPEYIVDGSEPDHPGRLVTSSTCSPGYCAAEAANTAKVTTKDKSCAIMTLKNAQSIIQITMAVKLPSTQPSTYDL
jgi:hypothetical protein